MKSLIHVFDDLGDDDNVRSIVLTGAGKIFSAGADIKERGAIRDAKGEFTRSNRIVREFFYSIMECPKPVICAVNGPALGAGFSLVTVCDIALASENAVFGMPEVDVGMAGGTKFMLRFFGQSKARMLLYTGERIPASELYRTRCHRGLRAPGGADAARPGDCAQHRGKESPRRSGAQAKFPNGREPALARPLPARTERDCRVVEDRRFEGGTARLPQKRKPVFKGC